MSQHHLAWHLVLARRHGTLYRLKLDLMTMLVWKITHTGASTRPILVCLLHISTRRRLNPNTSRTIIEPTPFTLLTRKSRRSRPSTRVALSIQNVSASPAEGAGFHELGSHYVPRSFRIRLYVSSDIVGSDSDSLLLDGKSYHSFLRLRRVSVEGIVQRLMPSGSSPHP